MENNFIFRSESGSISPIRFAKPKAYDSDGNEIIIPICECGEEKQQIIGKECFAWICTTCGK